MPRGHKYDSVTERCEYCDIRWWKTSQVDCPAGQWTNDLGFRVDPPLEVGWPTDKIGFEHEWRECGRCHKRFPGKKYWSHRCTGREI